MKTKTLILILIINTFFINFSCKKTTENIIDCISSGILLSIEENVDISNPKIITYKINGSNSIISVEWDFGDNKKSTTESSTTIHAYVNSGNFNIKAKVNLEGGCSPNVTKEIIIK